MSLRQFTVAAVIFISALFSITKGNAQYSHDQKHIEVSLRMIGHEVLLSLGDSTSRVLPITKKKDRYIIQFESEFEFKPEELVNTINRVVADTRMANRYIVEVEQCKTREVVYSFEMDDLEQSYIIPCGTRKVSKSCYNLLFTLIEIRGMKVALHTPIPQRSDRTPTKKNTTAYLAITLLVVLVSSVLFFLWKRKNKPTINPNLISLGKYQFDTLNTELLIEDEKVELTSKEADLLLLLHNAANTTVEREVILNKVWGDNGDYVGRTLDVFISKLRKKLEADPTVKIVNIRGVGYKLVMEV